MPYIYLRFFSFSLQDNNSHERFNKHVNSGYECRSPNMPDDFKSCKGVVAAWGLGGDSFAFPADAGN